MNMLVSTLFLLSTLVALSHTAGINILPRDAATELKRCAWRSGWYASNIRKGYTRDATSDRDAANRHLDTFKRKMDGILSQRTCDKIKSMFGYAAWHTANTRWNYHSDARRDRRRVNQLYSDIINSGEIGGTLARNIREMGWAAAWHCANTRVGYHNDARRDRERFNSYFNKISGDVRLVRLNWQTNDFNIINRPPDVIKKKVVPNCTDRDQTAEITFTESIGTTYSYTHEVSFEHTISAGFQAGIVSIGLDVTYSTSFTVSQSSSFSEAIERTRTTTYRFPLTTAPYSTNEGKITIHQAEVDIPYNLVFDFQGVEKTVRGTWRGISVSHAVFAARAVEHDPSRCTR